MKKATNELPTISIQGRDYVLVKDRIAFFNETYQNGAIQTELVSSDNKQWVVKATVTPDVANPTRVFTGYSQAVEGQGMVNKTAALENSESSAVGRALAMMGIGVIDSIASADEMHKAQGSNPLPWENKAETADEREMRESIEESSKNPSAGLPGVPCPVCGRPTTYKEGTSKAGKHYKGYFCESGEKNHVQWAS